MHQSLSRAFFTSFRVALMAYLILVNRRLADGMCLDDDRPQRFSWITKTPGNWRNFLLACHSSATTVSHVDASGLCTWIHVVTGDKMWFAGYRKDGSRILGAGDTLLESIRSSGIFLESDLDWVAIPLQTGDDLYVFMTLICV